MSGDRAAAFKQPDDSPDGATLVVLVTGDLRFLDIEVL